MIVQAISIPIIGIVASAAIFVFYFKKNKFVYLFFKSLTTLCIVSFCFASYFVYANSGTTHTAYISFIFIGLLFSLAGDITIFFKKSTFFIIALICFACTHILYTLAFLLSSGFFLPDIWIGIIILGLFLFYYRLFSPHLSKLKKPVVLYMCIISFMVWRACSALFDPGITLFRGSLIALGAILFYISDILLALNMFVKPVKKFHLKNLSLYYLGQVFIALSCYYLM